MEKKKADNNISDIKKRINEIDDKIDISKQMIKKIEVTQEELVALNRNVEKCIDLLSKSMKGSSINYLFKDMSDSNKIFFLKTASILDEQIESTRKSLNNLYQEKDECIKKNRESSEKE